MSKFSFQNTLHKIIQFEDLSATEMSDIMSALMEGHLTAGQVGGFLVGMRMKGETITELVAAAKVLRNLMTPVPIVGPHVVDIVGTGGDQAYTFNISTASAFVVAAAGGCVAKHGNRSVSSRSGSADVLEAAGVNIRLTPHQVAVCAEQIGVGFMFAPSHHLAMKHASGPRKELGIRTFFNLIGPLTNPAGACNQLVGVFSKQWLKPLAEALQQLGNDRAMVVHAEDGLDEISNGAITFVAELKGGNITTYTISPEQFGFTRSPIDMLKVGSVDESLQILQQALQNKEGPARDIIALNSGAAIYLAGLADDLSAGVAKAQQVLKEGAAYEKLQALISLSQKLAMKL